jgi:hypothetical protein
MSAPSSGSKNKPNKKPIESKWKTSSATLKMEATYSYITSVGFTDYTALYPRGYNSSAQT